MTLDLGLAADAYATKTVLHKLGWIQGRYQSPTTGAVCLTGAVRIAIFADAYLDTDTKMTPEQITRHARLTRAIHHVAGTDFIPRWNDEPRRTLDDVMGVLEAIIEASLATSTQDDHELAGGPPP